MLFKHLLLLASLGCLSFSRPLIEGRSESIMRNLQDGEDEIDDELDDDFEDDDAPEAASEAWSQAFIRLSTGQEEPEEEEEEEDEEPKSSRPPAPTEKDWSELFTFLAIMGAQTVVLIIVCFCCAYVRN